MDATREDHFQKVDSLLANWAQGDYFLGVEGFIIGVNPSCHISTTETLSKDDLVISQNVEGLCVLTQTCDIVRSCKERPFLEVGPLVQVSEEILREIKKEMRPNYGFIPALESSNFVVDLDRVMTIEKSVLIGKTKVRGCGTDIEQSNFGRVLARKRGRFAFPNDFVDIARPYLSKLKDKHSKKSPEGEFLRSVREIRALASPDWNAQQVDLHLYYILQDDSLPVDSVQHQSIIKAFEGYLKLSGRYLSLFSEVTNLDNLSAKEYLHSSSLDLDHLS